MNSESPRAGVTSRRVFFTNLHGCRLSGILDLPTDGKPKAFAVFSHCFTCNKRYKVAVYLGRLLAQRGIAMLRYDFPGLGESEGDFSLTTFQGYVSDVRHACEFLRREYDSPRILIGHSFGGGASLAAAASVETVQWVVTLAATARPSDDRPGFRAAKKEAESIGIGRFETGETAYPLRREFFDRLAEVDLEPSVRSLRANLLVVHAADDPVVPFDNAELLVRWAPRGQLLQLDRAGHLFAEEVFVRPIADAIAAQFPG